MAAAPLEQHLLQSPIPQTESSVKPGPECPTGHAELSREDSPAPKLLLGAADKLKMLLSSCTLNAADFFPYYYFYTSSLQTCLNMVEELPPTSNRLNPASDVPRTPHSAPN